MIDGVRTKKLRAICDERGRLMEVLRSDDELFGGFGQAYITTAYPGVVKGWHYHKIQTDSFTVIKGMLKLVLYDDREGSPTRGEVNEFFIGEHNTLLVQIPPLVLHGFKCISPEEAIVLTSSGNIQAQLFQEMAFTQPRTYISAGGFSTMGWSYPAALGARLAAPDKPVVAMVGDGDFLMTFQEIATAVQYNIPVVAVVLNNLGWQAIRDLQRIAFGEGTDYGSMFEQGDQPVTPHIADAARAFGAHAVRVSRPDEVAPALHDALMSGCPAVVEVMVDTQLGTSGGAAPGWWDVPIPDYYRERRAAYEREKREERL